MKKEKWLLKEIENWQTEEIINEETAVRLKSMYQPKNGIGFLIVLFSVIGSLLIGMGIVLVSANNWWYSLPVVIRTFIGFLPLIVSQMLVIYVFRCKMNSIAFRESAALLNMAGVFASIAIVGQIFHLPGDFTNYLLVCGILFLPSMLIMNAVSPLIVFYWTAINGGIYFADEVGVVISLTMFIAGAVFALNKCREKNSKSVYLSLITVISGFVLILVSALEAGSDLSVVLYGYSILLLSSAKLLKGSENVFLMLGRVCMLVLTIVLTYMDIWSYNAELEGIVFIILTVLVCVAAAVLLFMNIRAKKYCPFSVVAFIFLIPRAVWCIFDLTEYPEIFMIVFNVVLFVLSIFCIFEGAKKIDLYNANTGMITLCLLIILRFFDSELPLYARGIVFLCLGAGFLIFNLFLVGTKKKLKEEQI